MRIFILIAFFFIYDIAFVLGYTSTDQLSSKEQHVVHITIHAASGTLDKLEEAIHQGLNDGLTINELKECLIHMHAYAGFPRSIRGLQTAMKVVEARKASGITDAEGKQASPIATDQTKYVRGKMVLEELTGKKEPANKTGYAAFAPPIEVFLKEHLFADLFERDVLTYREREIVTIATLTSLGGLEPMLNSHLNICLHLGMTPKELLHFSYIIQKSTSEKHAQEATLVINQVLNSKI